jgi:hypothetical protein
MFRYLTTRVKHRHIALTENGNVETTIGAESHAIRTFPARRRIRPDYVSEQGTRSSNLAGLPSVPIDIPGHALICVKQIVRAKSNSVGELETPINLRHSSALHIHTIHTPIV